LAENRFKRCGILCCGIFPKQHTKTVFFAFNTFLNTTQPVHYISIFFLQFLLGLLKHYP